MAMYSEEDAKEQRKKNERITENNRFRDKLERIALWGTLPVGIVLGAAVTGAAAKAGLYLPFLTASISGMGCWLAADLSAVKLIDKYMLKREDNYRMKECSKDLERARQNPEKYKIVEFSRDYLNGEYDHEFYMSSSIRSSSSGIEMYTKNRNKCLRIYCDCEIYSFSDKRYMVFDLDTMKSADLYGKKKISNNKPIVSIEVSEFENKKDFLKNLNAMIKSFKSNSSITPVITGKIIKEEKIKKEESIVKPVKKENKKPVKTIDLTPETNTLKQDIKNVR